MTADPPSRSDGPDPGLDVDAAFAEIVAHWGPATPDVPEEAAGATLAPEPPPRAPVAPPVAPPAVPPAAPPAATAPVEPVDPVESGWGDTLNSRATWEDEGHFVPPAPPPLPTVEPRRRTAWIALLGSPVLGLVLVLLQIGIPSWVSTFLVCAFVGGFGYLVATMGPSSRDDWSGDDGAVL